MTPRVVLITGVSRYLGARLAYALSQEPSIERIIGVDTVAPTRNLMPGHARTEFVRADIRSPLIAKVINASGVDTVVHMNISATPHADGGRVPMKELNVMGTMQLLAACQRSSSVRRLVVKSTSAVYGASPRDPALFTEDMQAKGVPDGGYAKDAGEIESYVRGFARRRPDIGVSVLRFCNFIGPQIDSILTGYFALPVIPVTLGYDARLQLLHEDDAVGVLRYTVLADDDRALGVTNVGADELILLSQAIRRAGRAALPLPSPAARRVGSLIRRLGLADFSPEQMRFLNFGRVMDTTRMKDTLGFTPRYTTAEAFESFIEGRGLAPAPPMSWLQAAFGAGRGSEKMVG